MIIRKEVQGDFRAVEELTRRAFWNLNGPGCNEHYLVHTMRGHKDFLPELDFVVELDGKIIANIMYTKAKLTAQNGETKEVLTFGPLSVMPEYQRKGYGKKLLEYSFSQAAALGYDAIVIFGNPENYYARGFKSCIKYHISVGNGIYPTALLVRELRPGAIPENNWDFLESEVFELDEQAALEFDKGFEPLVREYRASQELFYIYSHSRVFD